MVLGAVRIKKKTPKKPQHRQGGWDPRRHLLDTCMMEVVTLSPTDGPELVELRPNAVLELYSDDQGKILQFTYVVSTTGKTFVFTNEHIWLPQ